MSHEQPRKYKPSQMYSFDIELTNHDELVELVEKTLTVNIEMIMRPIAAIHKSSIGKYAPLSWEKRINEKYDNTFFNNLDAIFRHSFRMLQGEYEDPESGYPHIEHILCRWQMAGTTLLRLTPEGTYRTREYTDSDLDWLPGSPEVKVWSTWITPETFWIYSHLDTDAIDDHFNNWHNCDTDDFRNRMWFSVMNMCHFTLREHIPNKEQVLEDFLNYSESLIAYCLVYLTRK